MWHHKFSRFSSGTCLFVHSAFSSFLSISCTRFPRLLPNSSSLSCGTYYAGVVLSPLFSLLRFVRRIPLRAPPPSQSADAHKQCGVELHHLLGGERGGGALLQQSSSGKTVKESIKESKRPFVKKHLIRFVKKKERSKFKNAAIFTSATNGAMELTDDLSPQNVLCVCTLSDLFLFAFERC